MKICTSMVLVLAIATTASAGTPAKPTPPPGTKAPPPAPSSPKLSLEGNDARTLTLALKLAGVAAKKAAGAVTYTVSQLSCTTTDGSVSEDGLETTFCHQGTGKDLAEAQSSLLGDAVGHTLKDAPSDSHMSKTTTTVASITCKIAPDDKAPKTIDRFSCDVALK